MEKEREGWHHSRMGCGPHDPIRSRRGERWENRGGSSGLLRGYRRTALVPVDFPAPSQKLRDLPRMRMEIGVDIRSVSVSIRVL